MPRPFRSARPTFYGRTGFRLLEAHLLDFDEDIYDELVTVTLVRRLRNIVRFGGVDEFVAQLHDDAATRAGRRPPRCRPSTSPPRRRRRRSARPSSPLRHRAGGAGAVVPGVGVAASLATFGGSSPRARSASVTCSRTERSAARVAIHSSTNASSSPVAASSWGRTPRTDARGPSTARMTSATVISAAGRASVQPPSAAAAALQDAAVAQEPQDVVQEPRRQVVGGRQHVSGTPPPGSARQPGQRRRDPHGVGDLVGDPHTATVASDAPSWRAAQRVVVTS